jgi:ribosomal protein L37AE/L43A
MKNAKHIIRAFVLLFVLLTIFDVGRRLIAPASYGKYGNYRGDNLKTQMDMAVKWEPNTQGECAKCHSKEVGIKDASKHKVVPCMDCHGTLAGHVKKKGTGDELEKSADMLSEKSRKNCERCHSKLAARAKILPMQDILKHLEAKGADKNDTEACIGCHDGHNPHLDSDVKKPEPAKK